MPSFLSSRNSSILCETLDTGSFLQLVTGFSGSCLLGGKDSFGRIQSDSASTSISLIYTTQLSIRAHAKPPILGQWCLQSLASGWKEAIVVWYTFWQPIITNYKACLPLYPHFSPDDPEIIQIPQPSGDLGSAKGSRIWPGILVRLTCR